MKKNSLLIVDDVYEMRSMLALVMEDEGYTTTQAENGLAAFELLLDKSFDLMITDILMPEMDGLELARKARVIRPDMPIIFITGGGRQLPDEKLDGTGTDQENVVSPENLIRKPFNPLELMDLVGRLIRSP